VTEDSGLDLMTDSRSRRRKKREAAFLRKPTNSARKGFFRSSQPPKCEKGVLDGWMPTIGDRRRKGRCFSGAKSEPWNRNAGI
jgi:hypothetical protein